MTRILNRLRLIFDNSITCANALDKAAHLHPESVLFYPTTPLPYHFLNEAPLNLLHWQKFVNKLGNLLIENGLKKDDRVAIYKTNNLDYFFLALAVIKSGGIAVPINPGMSVENIRYYLNYVGAKFVFTDENIVNQNKLDLKTFKENYIWLFPDSPVEFGANCIDINKSLAAQPDQLQPVDLSRDSIALIAHTSGTTGFPKGVMCSSGGIVEAIKGHYKSEPIGLKNKIAVAGHYNHLVYYVGFFTSMLSDMRVWVLSPNDTDQIFEKVEAEQINIFFAFPDVYLRMFGKNLANYNLGSVKVWISTADASHGVHIKAFCNAGAFLKVFGKKVVGAVFIDVIGASEVGSGALRRIVLPFYRQAAKRCIGRPFWGGPAVKVADERGKKLPPGTPGRLLVKGNMLFKGYWDAPETLAGTMFGDWWWTGDCVERDFLGNFYHLDRYVDRIQTSSGTFYSLLVEEKLLSHSHILEAVVFGIPDQYLGQAPVAVVALFPNLTLRAEEILEWANQSGVCTPQLKSVRVVAPDSIPRGLTGKVLKRMLREEFTVTKP